MWLVELLGNKGRTQRLLIPLAIDANGKRYPAWEKDYSKLFELPASESQREKSGAELVCRTFETMLQREVEFRCQSVSSQGYNAKLVAWIEVDTP